MPDQAAWAGSQGGLGGQGGRAAQDRRDVRRGTVGRDRELDEALRPIQAPGPPPQLLSIVLGQFIAPGRARM